MGSESPEGTPPGRSTGAPTAASAESAEDQPARPSPVEASPQAPDPPDGESQPAEASHQAPNQPAQASNQPAQAPDPPAGESQPARDARQRLHPAAMALGPLRQVGPLLVLALTGTLATDAWSAPALVLVLAVMSIGGSVVAWLRFTWQVTPTALVIEQGLLERRRREIPLDRIQAVDLVRGLRHRLLGVVEVRVEAIGGAETEGVLAGLGHAQAARLRTVLLRRTAPDGPAAGPAAPLVTLRPGRLVVAGLTGGRVGVALALLGLADQLLGERVWRVFGLLPGLAVGTAIAVAVAGVVLVFAIGVAATALAFWGFELRRDGDVLTVTRGLLEQRHDTIPLSRVQALRIDENIVRRLFGLAAVKVTVAGRSGGEDAAQTALLLPLGSRAEAARLVGEVLEVSGLGSVELQPMPLAARRRRLARAGGAAVLAWVGLGLLARWAALPPAMAVLAGSGVTAVAVLLALASYRALGHREGADHLVARSGVLVRRTVFVPTAKLQSLAMRQSPWQRAAALAHVDLHIPTGFGVRSPRLLDVGAATACSLLRRLPAAVTPPVAHPAAAP